MSLHNKKVQSKSMTCHIKKWREIKLALPVYDLRPSFPLLILFMNIANRKRFSEGWTRKVNYFINCQTNFQVDCLYMLPKFSQWKSVTSSFFRSDLTWTMGYAPPPYDDSQRLSLKPSMYKTLHRRYHLYSQPDSVLFKVGFWNLERFNRKTYLSVVALKPFLTV